MSGSLAAEAAPPLTALDEDRLRAALALAERSIGLSEPNPRVGCLISDAQGDRLASGWTQQAGGPHAEVMALREAARLGLQTQGGCAWVSLEPCAHHGRTPPCCDALIAAGLKRVVVAAQDPFPGVDGQGISKLRAAGIEVLMAPPGATRQAAREINIGFFSRLERGRPWVRLKVAMSLDARTALGDGRSQWITSAAARQDGHAWRRRAGAVLTGIGTVLSDDPRLDVREVPTQVHPLRVVLDSQGRLPAGARVLQPPGRVLVAGLHAQRALPEGAEYLSLPPGTEGRGLDLRVLLQALASREVNELHVEAGAGLNGALLGAGLVDELLLYLAPKLIGPGRPLADLAELPSLQQAMQWHYTDARLLGPDLRLLARRQRLDA